MPYKELGMDERYAQVSLLVCPLCGQLWLRYHFELEAFSESGRWYLGAIPEQQAPSCPQNAKAVLEELVWYFYGGSYFGGQSGKRSGPLSV
jgi:hypothetical protein